MMMAKAGREQLVTSDSPTDDQIILHLDMDCFFAACERLRRPELEGEPVVIGGGFDSDPPRGAVATASYEAREYGVQSAQPMAVALENLPRRAEADEGTASGYYLKGDHGYYKSISSDVMTIVRQQADTIRHLSIDEAYLDLTTETTWTMANRFARELQSDITEQVGVTASIGVAPTMSCAKIASDYDKPDGLCVVPPGAVREFLGPLDIEDIHGVGPVSAKKFRASGVEQAGDLAELSPQEVVDRFGSNTRTLYDRVRGIDPREVKPVGKPKSLSKEKSIEASSEMETKRAVVQALAEQVTERVRAKNARYRTIGIKVVGTPFDVNTRETSLHGPIQDHELLVETAMDLLMEFETTEVRKLGVRVSKLDFSNHTQIRLDEWTPPDWAISSGGDTDSLRGQTRLTDF